MPTPTFEEIVRAWLLSYDDRIPSDTMERREAFVDLLGNLEDHGYNKDDLNSSRKEKIIRSCVNPYHNNKTKLRKWISIVVNDFEAATLVYYGTVKIRRNVMTDEMRAKFDGMQKKAEETRALRTSDSGEEGHNNGEINLQEQPLDISTAIYSELNNPTKEKEPERPLTEEMLDAMEGPEIVWDEEFVKRLELGDE